MSTVSKPVYCQHLWGDQMSGSDGAFRVCGGACKATWMDGQPEPQKQIGQIQETEEIQGTPYLNRQP